MRMLEFELGSCWQPHTAHAVATTRAAGRAGRHATMIVEDLQTLGSQPVMPENLPNHWHVMHGGMQCREGGRHGKYFGGHLAELARIMWITSGFPLVVPKWGSPRLVIRLPLSLPLVW